MSKQRYICIDGHKIPVSKEVYQAYHKFARKERYFSEDLKQEQLLYDPERHIAILLPSREDSFERLVDSETQFADPNAVKPEEAAVKADLLERLTQAMHTLTDDELSLIQELFYLEKTEREASAALNMALTTLHDRKSVILRKLRKLLENFS